MSYLLFLFLRDIKIIVICNMLDIFMLMEDKLKLDIMFFFFIGIKFDLCEFFYGIFLIF